MTRLLLNWVAIVVAVMVATQLFPPTQLSYTTFQGLALFALVLGLLNAFVAPIIKFFTFPLTLLTLGLFSLVINAVMFLLAASLSHTVQVDGFLSAFVAAILVSLVNVVVRRVIK